MQNSTSTHRFGARRIAALCLAGSLGFFGALGAAGAATDKADTTYVTKAAAAGMLEVQASQTAITRASDPDVRAFAQRMVKDHTAVGDELKSLAGKKGITVPDSLPADERAKVDKLSAMEGAKFDKAYAEEIGVKAHKEAVALFDQASKNAKDPDIKAFFTHNLPALREHLQMAQQLKPAK
jgi:putative membrane protein